MVQENSVKNKIVIICGPTGSGKTDFAIELAKKINGEIVSADSMTIYKDLNIGTAKPSEIQKQQVVHHMIDVVDCFDTFSVGDYREMALPIVEDVLRRNKVPIICGGTGFYINSILYNYSYGKGDKNIEAREKYKELAKEKGNLYVYNILMKKDPKSAEKLHFNDLKRVVRALEIYENGYKKSDIIDELIPRYDYLAYSTNPDRDKLYENIDKRVDEMIELGLVDEVKGLVKKGVTISNQCMQGIGYKEIYAYLNNEISIQEAVDKIKLNTRHYAKRQITFFKKMQNLQYLTNDFQKDLQSITEKI